MYVIAVLMPYINSSFPRSANLEGSGNFATSCEGEPQSPAPVDSEEPLQRTGDFFGQNRWGTNSWGETGRHFLARGHGPTAGFVGVLFIRAHLTAEVQPGSATPAAAAGGAERCPSKAD